MNIKEQLYKLCEKSVNQRLQTVEAIIASNQKALQTETKSSVGDKHETGRAMLQLEMEKAGQQLKAISLIKETLAKITVSKIATNAHLGSVIITDKANYFLAISVGQLVVEKKTYFAISVSSPIGKLLLGKQENDIFIFNNNQIKIKQIF